MELDKVLLERRTIRKFFDKEVSWLVIAEVLNAGRLAPSAGNLQNWNFIVLRKKETRLNVIKCASGNEWVAKAPVLVVICADVAKGKKLYGEKRGEIFSIQSCANATIQMMLKAYELGLGSAWIGTFDEAGVSKTLEISKDFRPLTILALGYGETQNELDRMDLSLMVSFEKFGEKERKGDYSMAPLSIPFNRNVEHMKDRLNTAFASEGTGDHKEKLKKFVDKFKLTKKK
jgi:nitroreductase